ncbi:uncharacterized protein LOC108907396 isoform X2 [Anoplophora glabripennis]|nr:uncharacterized protein LOC108907396 isoform X2 [Anoplophora glabripennis]XP_018566577.1 uncharacterized protein LOC108907396 isoform X2 [Anoplophora glabripennis]
MSCENLSSDTESLVTEEEVTPPTNSDEEEEPEPDLTDEDFEYQVVNACKNFTKTINDLATRKDICVAKNKDARLLLDKANAGVASAKQDLDRKEANCRSLRESLESLRRQVSWAEEQLQISRKQYDRWLRDEETANKEFKYSVKDLRRLEMAETLMAKHFTNFFQQKKKAYALQCTKSGQ